MELHIIRFHTDTSFLFFSPRRRRKTVLLRTRFPPPPAISQLFSRRPLKTGGGSTPTTREECRKQFSASSSSLSQPTNIWVFPFSSSSSSRTALREIGRRNGGPTLRSDHTDTTTSTTLVLLFPPFHLLPAMVRFCSTKIPPIAAASLSIFSRVVVIVRHPHSIEE